MKGLPKGARTAPLAPALNPGDLVLYENDGAPILALILALKRDRFQLLNDRAREVELPAARLYRIPFTTEMPNGQRERADKLIQLVQQARTDAQSVALADVWGLVFEQPREYTVTELAELAAPRDSLAAHLATFLALMVDRTYFKRHKDTFSPRPKETVEQLLHAAAVVAERRAKQQRVLQELRGRLADRDAALSADVENAIHLLKEVAAECDGLQEREAEIREWLEVCGSGLGTTQHGTLADQAGDILDRTGFLSATTNLAPIRHRIRSEHSPELLTAAEERAARPLPADPSRRDLTALSTFTIDDASTQDMDDALSVEHTGEGFRLGIHIVDITASIDEGGVLDSGAKQRATSLYLPERTIHMFPDALAGRALSLLPGESRPAVSCFVELDRRFAVRRTEIVRSTIRSARRYTYDEVTALLDGSDRELAPLYEIAMHYESERLEKGAIKAAKRDLILSADQASGRVSFTEIDEADPARNLVGELMVWVNQLFAEFAVSHGAALIFRGQAPCDVDPHIAAQRVPPGPAQDYVVRSLFKRSETSCRPIPHASLGLRAYAQISSPIRRYADLVNQRQLVSLLQGKGPRYTESDITDYISQLEEPLGRAAAVSKESRRFWMLQYIANEKRSEILEGTVLKDDPRGTLVELSSLYFPVMLRSQKRLRPGDVVKLRVVDIRPRSDLIRLELV